MEDDAGGFGEYHVAVFGTPGSGQFEWEMTGRHMTIRADGDSVENVAFGGPIVYGHGEGDSKKGLPGNVFYYQTKKANEVFSALDGKQRDSALLPKAPKEDAVLLQGSSGTFPGIAVGELSRDQKDLVESVMKVILAPYREDDVKEAVAILKDGGGLDGLHMSFYKSNDIGDDQEWDIWRLEGPTFVWHFRGAAPRPLLRQYRQEGVNACRFTPGRVCVTRRLRSPSTELERSAHPADSLGAFGDRDASGWPDLGHPWASSPRSRRSAARQRLHRSRR